MHTVSKCTTAITYQVYSFYVYFISNISYFASLVSCVFFISVSDHGFLQFFKSPSVNIIMLRSEEFKIMTSGNVSDGHQATVICICGFKNIQFLTVIVVPKSVVCASTITQLVYL